MEGGDNKVLEFLGKLWVAKKVIGLVILAIFVVLLFVFGFIFVVVAATSDTPDFDEDQGTDQGTDPGSVNVQYQNTSDEPFNPLNPFGL